MSSLLLPGMMLPGSAAPASTFPGASELGKAAGFVLGGGTPLSSRSMSGLFGSNVTARVVTGLLGLLLIAAAIFTHPTVINVGKKVGKAAAEGAALA